MKRAFYFKMRGGQGEGRQGEDQESKICQSGVGSQELEAGGRKSEKLILWELYSNGFEILVSRPVAQSLSRLVA